MDGAFMHRVASHLLGILIFLVCGFPAYASPDSYLDSNNLDDNTEWKTQTKNFNHQFFRVGSYAVVELDDVPAGDEALIHEVHVTWQDRDEKTSGQLYLNDFLYLWPEKIPLDMSTYRWEMIDWPSHKVQIQILDTSEDKSGWGARIDTITVTYTTPIPPEDDDTDDAESVE